MKVATIQKTESRGFTLVEMIVAVGLFTIVMFVAMGALLSLVSLNKKAQAQQAAINNINYALENMARSIRTGTNYVCVGQGPTSGATPQTCTEFAYTSDASDVAAGELFDATDAAYTRHFRFHTDGATGSKTIQKSKDDGSTWFDITDPSIVIDSAQFTLVGTGAASSGDVLQPKVLISVAGHAFVNENTASPRRVDFNLQTLASQRKLDI